jgi:hypothetical protein
MAVVGAGGVVGAQRVGAEVALKVPPDGVDVVGAVLVLSYSMTNVGPCRR